MAGEIQLEIPSLPTYATFVVKSATGQYWNIGTVAFESYNAANIANYGIAMTADGASSFYRGTFPSGIAAGVYRIIAFVQAIASFAVSDTLNIAGSQDDFQWNGSAILPLQNLPVNATQLNSSAAGAAAAALFFNSAIATDAVATAASGSDFTGSAALSSETGHYAGCFLMFTSGANKGVSRKITTYTGATRRFQFSGGLTTSLDAAFLDTPSAADTFLVGGRA